MFRSFVRPDLWCILAAVAVAPAHAQRAYVAPTDATVRSDTEVRSEYGEHLIFVANRSTVPVTVFSVSLTRCENVKERCDPRRVNIKLPPGARRLAMRVTPESRERSFSYSFRFGWRAESSSGEALAALAEAGDGAARQRLADRARQDSIARTPVGARHRALTRDDFDALRGQVAGIRAEPESLVVVPGTRRSALEVHLLLLDASGAVLGRTQWMRWQFAGSRDFEFPGQDALIGRSPGRMLARYRLAPDAERVLGVTPDDIDVPIIAAYPQNAMAPVFTGRALDADSRAPLACALVALEDSARNVVVRGRASRDGEFLLTAPLAGAYRVRIEAPGWSPSYGPLRHAAEGEAKQGEFAVRFEEQLLSAIDTRSGQLEHARLTAMATTPSGPGAGRNATPIERVEVSGSESRPLLGIIARVQPGTHWIGIAIDSAGRIDTARTLYPPELPAVTRTHVTGVLSRMRFAPARSQGVPACELQRLQVVLRRPG